MRPLSSMLTIQQLVLLSAISYGIATANPLYGQGESPEFTVGTLTGTYTGLQNPDFPGVREFRSIPYAEPPVGKLRWKPPVSLQPSKDHHYSHRFPPSCPQYLTSKLSLWNSNITAFSINTGDQSHHAGEMAQTTAEDCLSLAIWTPIGATPRDKLPVGFFMPGGSFKGGGLDAPHHIPAGWVNRSQNHIMVTMNYRVNIFGFPNAVGLEDQNIGILDQRLALEWVHANIEAFGGDPDRITLWGHSAGGVSADVLNFANHENPLAAGFFLMSGAAMRTFAQGDNALQTNFTHVAKELGCDFPDDADAELECMQQIPVNLITNFIGHYGDDGKKPRLLFRPTADDKIIFKNYTEQAEMGLISRVPALISDTSNEQSSLITYPIDNLLGGPNTTDVDKGTLDDFICPAFNSSNVRDFNNLTTYRYQYAGNYSNLTPFSWMGAYHGADLPMIFGSYNLTGDATDFQKKVAEAMQDYVLAFLTDPENGIKNLGWLPSNAASKGDMVRFGGGESIVQNISSLDIDGACMGKGVYDSHPER
ncbi:alpha/beta-hydrolase [Annulohypoxylon maeteangense]|uniref:alpha/beta-hydrolase n=1 Tax=Annulohypoxylon maeteangense TaxID=1927788 RepID=UPI002008CBBC|nr:alpha/beta-hydrolase [Annulohypoxylon maeteangense]KAI0886916.1 alpha/beta-hydrolase [Annulohypoxylon maeteangense]